MPSHKLLVKYILKDYSKNLTELEGKTLIEIGSTREITGIGSTQNSSEYFIQFCKKYKMKFISIDMDPMCSANALKFCKKHNFNNYEIKTIKGEEFLKEYKKPVFFIYLDAFDFWHNNHSETRKQSYKQNLNVELSPDDKLCHQMHLECVQHMVKNKCITSQTIICHDDIISLEKGKGVLSIPYLLKHNMRILEHSSGGMVLKL